MLAYTYTEKGKFELLKKARPVLQHDRDAIVRVTLSSICTSDLHIKHGSVPRAIPGVTVGHEMIGVVEEVGSAVTNVKPGDRVTVNVETFCGSCFFCRNGWVNNCEKGGWELGCRIDTAFAGHGYGVEAFAAAVLSEIHPRDSWRASKAFREHIAVELAKRCLTESVKLAGGAF